MTRSARRVILTVVLIAAVGVLVKPVLFPAQKEFTVTAKPYQAYQQAIASGTPIFLEFYANW